MSFWLARKRCGQHHDYIQRFDPRFWTVDFPRPMMASVVTTGPDSMRVECEFHNKGSLAGLIWESEDRLDHPLLAYATVRNYNHGTLRFRWRSSGLVPLNAAHGPTLTIEGRDANGAARSWYVRLWNYADGSPNDAQIALPFDELMGGWFITNGDPVYPKDIDRLFISLVPPGFVPGSHELLPARVNGSVELSNIAYEGEHALLETGDVMVPPHGTGMCTAYDDAYNQTPARLLRSMRGLGYRGTFIHYVGMSHYYRLDKIGDSLEATPNGELAQPAESWHRSYFTLAVEQGFSPIPSLSYELLNQDCPEAWKQRAHDDSPALTGWSPPSTLISPLNATGTEFLRNIASRFSELMIEACAPSIFQIGEPWWWVTADGKICLYDQASTDYFDETGNPPIIADMRQPLNADQKELLDRAGFALYSSTASVGEKVRQVMGNDTDLRLLVFTPTILDPQMPELYRANLPHHWAYPCFNTLQTEDYDWLTTGQDANRRAGYEFLQDRLGYPLEQQEYLSGFVLRHEDAEPFWQRIDAGLDEAARRGVARSYVWALPQVARDGYTRLPTEPEDKMQAFDNINYPLNPGRDCSVSPEFSTSVAVTASGHERRNSHWTDARLHYDVGPGIRSEGELGVLLAFFRARRGAARGFRLTDPFDHSSNGMTGLPGPDDQLLGTGDGTTSRFRLVKSYGEGEEPQLRAITRPQTGSLRISVEGKEISGWKFEDGGFVLFDQAPPDSAEIRAGFLFDVPVRFATDQLDISAFDFAAGEAPSVPLVEIREAV